MRFTRSRDGVERCTVRLRVRLTREELAAVRRATGGGCTPRELIELEADLAVKGFIAEAIDAQRRNDAATAAGKI